MVEIKEAPVPVSWAWRMQGEPVDMCCRAAWSVRFNGEGGRLPCDSLTRVSADWSLSVLLSNGQIVIVRAKK